MKTVLEEYNKNSDEDISLLAENINRKIKEIDLETKGGIRQLKSKAKRRKKDLIMELVKPLEGRIKDEDICIKITQLLPEVSDRFIRECLPEKYKKKRYSDNAKKQNKKGATTKEGEKFAEIPMKTPLNSQIEGEKKEDKKKQLIPTNVVGSTSIQNDDDGEPDSESESQVTGNPFKVPDYHQQQSFQQEKKDEDEKIKEYSDYKEPLLERLDLNKDGKPVKIVIAEDKDSDDDNNNIVTNDDNLAFEYPMSFGEIRDRIEPLFSKLEDTAQIWLHGIINIKTGKVVYLKFGRMIEDNKV